MSPDLRAAPRDGGGGSDHDVGDGAVRECGFPPRLPIPYSLSLRTSFAFRRATQSGPMDPPTRTLSIFHRDTHCRLFVRIFQRIVIPIPVRRKLLARKTARNDPLPTACRTNAPSRKRVPHRSAPANLSGAYPPIRRLWPPPALRTKDFLFAHGALSNVLIGVTPTPCRRGAFHA